VHAGGHDRQFMKAASSAAVKPGMIGHFRGGRVKRGAD
jgi:hypothetical protein